MEETQSVEFQNFNEFWDKKINEYEDEAEKIESQMFEKHKNELTTLEAELTQSLPLKLKISPQRLNYLKIIDNLAKQKEYGEAHKIKLIADALESKERDEALQLREFKIKNMLNHTQYKHYQEIQVLQKRRGTARDELNKNRSIELEK